MAQRTGDAVIRVASLLPGLHALAVAVPEIGRQLAHAAIEKVGVLENLIVEVILGRDPDRMRLDAHVDVLGYEDDAALRMHTLQVYYDRDDLIVGLAAGERWRQRGRDRLGLQEQPAAGRASARGLERNTARDIAAADRHCGGNQLVEVARSLARVARNFGDAFLVVVELLEREDWQVEIVLFEAIKAGGVVHQHVGIEHKELGKGGLAGLGDLRGETKFALDHGPPCCDR